MPVATNKRDQVVAYSATTSVAYSLYEFFNFNDKFIKLGTFPGTVQSDKLWGLPAAFNVIGQQYDFSDSSDLELRLLGAIWLYAGVVSLGLILLFLCLNWLNRKHR
jgi:hypothetical protein